MAIAGAKDDGLRFVAPAVSGGAVAVMAEKVPPTPLPDGVAFVRVGNARRALALAAAKFFPPSPTSSPRSPARAARPRSRPSPARSGMRPARRRRASAPSALVAPGREVYGSLTTPDPVALHQTLDELADEGVTHLVLEASSHGLDQHRLDGVRISAGAFTNLSRDHLDYHPTPAPISPPSCGCSASWCIRAAPP